MAGLAALLGDELVGKSGKVATTAALSDKKAVALYFSAHWCPPCRGFTPKLAEWYSKDLLGKGLEVVFVSSDKDDASFNEYYGEQPWLALPFDNRTQKDALSRKFKISGIPALVLLNPDGSVITKDGRSVVSQDPTGTKFPWIPKTFNEIFDDATLKSKDGQTFKGSSLKGVNFGIYFSAHWCPPCRGFTPKLAEWYTKDLKNKGFEVVFVSSDKDDASFNEYFGEMPWLALDFADRERKDELSQFFGVDGIPFFAIIGADGSVITKDGRSAVTADPTGAELPWYPKPVKNLKAGPGPINDVPMLLVFCEKADAATKKAIEDCLTPIATPYLDKAKAAGEDDPDLAFMIVEETGGLGERIRGMMKMGEPSGEPRMMMLDIPDNGGFYAGPEGAITADAVTKFIKDCETKATPRQQLEG